MFKIHIASMFILLLLAPEVYAGFSSYSGPSSSDTVAVPVQITNKGIYNLIISIQFLNEPYDQKIYNSDTYGKFINRLQVEWSNVALSQVLKSKEQNINDLAVLKSNIETEIHKLADELKQKYSLDKNVEVVFALSNFYLLEPKDN